MFEECRRRYYYYSYLADAGYYPEAPNEAKLALEMKSIKTLDMWVGEVVHDTIQWVLEQARNGVTISSDIAQKHVRCKLSNGWRTSAAQERRVPGDTSLNLFEHYYKIPVGPAVIQRIKDKAFTSVVNFMESELLRRILQIPTQRWLPIDRYASFRLDDLLVYVKFDFAVQDKTGIVVYDWKTGLPRENESRQLACYALYTSHKWEVPIANVSVSPVHLFPHFMAEERTVTEIEIEAAKEYLKETFQAMLKCVRNPAANIAAMEDFPMTRDLQKCHRCSFKGICEQGKYASGDLEPGEVSDEWE